MQPVQLLVTDEWNMQIDRLISLGIPQIPIARSRKGICHGRAPRFTASSPNAMVASPLEFNRSATVVSNKLRYGKLVLTRGFWVATTTVQFRARDRERIDRTNSMHESDSFLFGPDRTMSAASSMTSSRWHVWASVRARLAAPFGG